MDLGTVLGLIFGTILMIFGIVSSNGDLMTFVNIPSVLITIGGTIAALMVSYPLSYIMTGLGIVRKVVFTKAQLSPGEVIDMLVTFSEKARREGLLALEDDVEDVDDEFLKKGIQLVVDGVDPELVRSILSAELDKIADRHDSGKGFYDQAGYLAPAFGMIGTLIGLIIMLGALEDKASIGRGMGTALITTMYGAFLANLVFIPIAKKLGGLSSDEILLKEIMLEGTLSIQSGDNPRIVKDKLSSFLSPSVRKEISEKVEAR